MITIVWPRAEENTPDTRAHYHALERACAQQPESKEVAKAGEKQRARVLKRGNNGFAKTCPADKHATTPFTWDQKFIFVIRSILSRRTLLLMIYNPRGVERSSFYSSF